MPRRIRMCNYYDYSWRLNPNAVYVARPSRWGNPYKLSFGYTLEEALEKYKAWLELQLEKDPDFLEPLRGKDLVCFCHLDKPCHADILLEYANK